MGVFSTVISSLGLVCSAAGAAEQISYDAVSAAPSSHEILLENDRVRVLRVAIPPGVAEPVHDHRWSSVMYFERAQPITYISYTMDNGRMTETSRTDVPAAALSGAQAAGPEGLHSVLNRGSAPFVAIRVEFKDASPSE